MDKLSNELFYKTVIEIALFLQSYKLTYASAQKLLFPTPMYVIVIICIS